MHARTDRFRRRAATGAPAPNRILILGFAALTLGACASGFETVKSENRAKLYRLERGQTREQVLEEMGTEPQEYNKGVFGHSGIVPNPYDQEVHELGGDKVEIFYYATHIENTDGLITNDELTPLVLVDDILVGWGWTYLDAFVEQNDLTLNGPRVLGSPSGS
ncbi:MAG: DUF3192 domain-containing protein [Gemmatimonadota bacterium]|jgi:hypothetical protein